MQAIILGAGRGTRLGALAGGLPKPLLRIGDEYLLSRQIRLLRAQFTSINAITVVVGFRSKAVREVGGGAVRYVENSDYAVTNTATSLFLALQNDASPAILLNGDVVFNESALSCLSLQGTTALCEFKAIVVPEEVQVVTASDMRITNIGKDIGGQAESVGVYHLSQGFIMDYLNEYGDGDRGSYYEDVFRRMISVKGAAAHACRLSEGFACEVDTPDDYERAARLLGSAG